MASVAIVERRHLHWEVYYVGFRPFWPNYLILPNRPKSCCSFLIFGPLLYSARENIFLKIDLLQMFVNALIKVEMIDVCLIAGSSVLGI